MDSHDEVLREIQEALQRIDGRLEDLDERVARLEGEEAPQAEVVPEPQAPEPDEPPLREEPPRAQPVDKPEPRIPPAPPPPPERPPKPSPAPEAEPAPHPEPASIAAQEEPARTLHIEELIGGRWALWIGVVLLLISVGFGLAYGWRLLSETARIAIGAATGLVIVGLSELLRPRSESWFADGVADIGAGVLYLTVWGAVVRYGLIGVPAGLALMIVVVGIAVLLALRHDAQALIVLATIGGYLAPSLMPGDTGPADVGFWVYITVANAGLLAASASTQWPRLKLLVLLCAVALIPSEVIGATPETALSVFVFLTANFLVFVGIGTAYPLRCRTATGPWETVYLCGVPGAYLLGGVHLLQMLGAWPDGLLSIALAVLYGALYFVADRRMPDETNLSTTSLTLAVGFAVLAPALLVDGDVLTAIWALEAGALAWIGRHTGLRLLEYLAFPAWLLAALASLFVVPPLLVAEDAVIVNPRFATFALVVGAALLIVHLQLRAARSRPEAKALAESVLWLATPLLLLALSLEVHDGMSNGGPGSAHAQWFVMAAVWALVALGLHALTKYARLASTSILAFLIFGAATLTDLFQITTGALNPPWPIFANWRFGSTAVIGAAMAAAAWMRYRRTEPDAQPDDPLWLPGVLMLALAPSVETYAGVSEAASAVPVPSGLLAAAAVWACLSAVGNAFAVTRRIPSLQALTVIMVFGGVGVTIIASELPAGNPWPPFMNLRVLAFAAGIASLAAESRLLAQSEASDASGIAVAPALSVCAALLALWPITREIFAAFSWTQYPTAETWRNAAQVAISLSWGAYAALCLAWGMTRRSRIARWLGLVVLAAAVLKLFLWDLSFLEQPYRILSFGVLGLILIGVAWAYSRYGERLKELT